MSLDRMTVADVLEQSGNLFPSWLSPLQGLNQIMDRYYNKGVFKQLAAKVVFANGTSTGMITLPRRYESLLGIACDKGNPLPIYGQFREWKELSIGYVVPDEMTMVGVIDMGSGYPTSVDIATEGTIRWKIFSSSDVGKVMRVNGLGTVDGLTNQEVYGSDAKLGVTLTAANPTADTTQTFSSFDPPYGGIQLPINMVGSSEIYIVNSGVATLLARYEAGEIRPSYRRYKIGVVDSTDIYTFCKLKHTKLRDFSDYIVPSSLGAIMAGAQALIKEKAMAYDEANKIWAYGESLYNEQLKSFRGSAKPSFGLIDKALTAAPTSTH